MEDASHGNRKATFDPHDPSKVRHTKLGVWDLYEEIDSDHGRVPGTLWMRKFRPIFEGWPYVWRMTNDVVRQPGCAMLMGAWVTVDALASLIPAANLWFQGLLLHIIQVAIDTRAVDTTLLFRICVGRVACALLSRLLAYVRVLAVRRLSSRIERHYEKHLVAVRAKLDWRTFGTTSVQRQLNSASASSTGTCVAIDMLNMLAFMGRSIIQLCSQFAVLSDIARSKPDGLLYVTVGLSTALIPSLFRSDGFSMTRAWAATTNSNDYLRMVGLKQLVERAVHRQELVAGNLADYITRAFAKLSDALGDSAGDVGNLREQKLALSSFDTSAWLSEVLHQVPQVVFMLRAVSLPASIPMSLATLELINAATSGFLCSFFVLMSQARGAVNAIDAVKKLYEISNIQNKVVDGTVQFPKDETSKGESPADEDQSKSGISVEFRNVSFKYPDTESYALRDVSFALQSGETCVILGANGSGKSTILKLIMRLYDPDEGLILLGGHDIRTLKLFDLRQAVSCLFQDYTHFPLSIRDNIALGDPDHEADDERIARAAELGGADAVLAKLPEGLDTYLERPVSDHYAGLSEDTKTLFGRDVYSGIQAAAGMKEGSQRGLSGGEMQRLALSRTFMRSVTPADTRVGMLLFDEPSASLDPIAEHQLFEKLMRLRGRKTMLFSSHRFGALTQRADLIIYMDKAAIVETGKHSELLGRMNGRYASVWNMQAGSYERSRE